MGGNFFWFAKIKKNTTLGVANNHETFPLRFKAYRCIYICIDIPPTCGNWVNCSANCQKMVLLFKTFFQKRVRWHIRCHKAINRTKEVYPKSSRHQMGR